MTSCGNPETEIDAVMIRRVKFDKAKECVRCKTNPGNIVIRYAVYCKECFFPLIATKFRRSLEPSVNPSPDGTRRKGLRASGNLLVGLSGGLGSTVLLDLVNRTYFLDQPLEGSAEKVRGGKNHPRNGSVWSKAAVCYVETCSAFPGARDRIDEIRAVIDKYKRFSFIPLRIEDAFDASWWEKVGGQLVQQDLGIDITNEALAFSALSNTNDIDSPVARLKSYILSLPTQTAIPSAVQTLTRLLLLHTAISTGSSHLLLGTSLTSLSISLISSISQGGGFVVREEAQEEWTPRASVNAKNVNGHKDGAVRIIRPLRDVGMKECAIWAWWNGLNVVGREKSPGGKQSIGTLTKDFIIGLERDYPSTVSTIARTCAKLTPREESDNICALCERPAQHSIQDWKARISIRSLEDPTSTSNNTHNSETKFSPETLTTIPNAASSASLTPLLCYACHTTLTSRSIRGVTASSTLAQQKPVPLPTWVTSHLKSLQSTEDKAISRTKPDGEAWSQAKMNENQMKAIVADFLLD